MLSRRSLLGTVAALGGVGISSRSANVAVAGPTSVDATDVSRGSWRTWKGDGANTGFNPTAGAPGRLTESDARYPVELEAGAGPKMPVFDEERIYVGYNYGSIAAIDRDTFSFEWTRRGILSEALVVTDDAVIAPRYVLKGGSGWAYTGVAAFEKSSGERLWLFDDIHDWELSHANHMAVAGDGHVYLTISSGGFGGFPPEPEGEGTGDRRGVFALDAATGELAWEQLHEENPHDSGEQDVDAMPVYENGRVHVATRAYPDPYTSTAEMRTYDAETGELLVRREGTTAFAPVAHDGHLYYRDGMGTDQPLVAVEVDSTAVVWEAPVDGRTRRHHSVPYVAAAGDRVLYATWDRLYAVDAHTGERAWTFDPEVAFDVERGVPADVAIAEDVVYLRVQVRDGPLRIVGLDARTGEMLTDLGPDRSVNHLAVDGADIYATTTGGGDELAVFSGERLDPIELEQEPTEPEIDQPVTFEVRPSRWDAERIESVTWYVGDEPVGEGTRISHAFEAAGEHEVAARVSDGAFEATVTTTLHVEDPPTPTPTATPSPSGGEATAETDTPAESPGFGLASAAGVLSLLAYSLGKRPTEADDD